MSNLISQTFIQDVLARSDIVELIQSRIQLNKRGNSYLARCPFHDEKTPSFSVSADKQFYYCFGCGAHGNAIDFLKTYDQLEFPDAIAHLAGQLGMEVPQSQEEAKKSEVTQPFYPLLQKVTQYYQQALRTADHAIEYLKSRGLTGQTAKHFAIGYAPSQWENLPQHFDHNAQSHLMTNGLLIKKESRRYDRFRNRIMFPIRDVRGRVIAFGGRAIGDDSPKYMNSPETPIFHKSNELYGLYEARQQHRQLKRVIIVEGYMDVVSLHQCGITYAVATLGTATNPQHLKKLLRYTHEVIFCFDGDTAGRNAAWKALIMSLPVMHDGIHIRFLFLPQDEDPDSLVQKIGQRRFEQQLDQAEPLSDVFFKQLQNEIPLHSLDDKAHFAKQACQYLNTMPHGLFRELLFDQLSKLLKIEIDSLGQLLTPLKPTKPSQRPAQADRMLPPAYLAIALLLRKPTLAASITDLAYLSTIQAPGITLLLKLIAHFQQHPTSSTGALLACCPDGDDQRRIARLAAHELPIEDAGLQLELQGALKRLREQHTDQVTQILIEKAKNSGLTPDEKKKLHQLLTNSGNGLI